MKKKTDTLSAWRVTLAWSLLSLFSIAAVEASDATHQMKLRNERVIVFKDGYCMVIKEGIATTDSKGEVFTHEVPQSAILGSFWAIPEQGTIKSMVAGWQEVKSETTETINCTTTAEIIQANLGRECVFDDGRNQRVSGTILKLLSAEPTRKIEHPTAQDDPFNSSFATSSVSHGQPLSTTVTPARTSGHQFLLRTKMGDVAIAVSSVKNLTIESMVSTTERTVEKMTRQKRLSFRFDRPNQAVKIRLMYFRPDVRWIPTYRVNLTEDEFIGGSGDAKRKTAEIAMQGELLNEAEDFLDVPFHVVVGVPNFRFRDVPSPMTLEATVRNALAQAAPNIMGNGSVNAQSLSNAMYTQRSSEFRSHRAANTESSATVALPEDLSGKGGQDIYVYELPAMSLKKGERATVPIMTAKVGYRDIYTWDVNITHAETYAASSAGSTSPLVLSENRIWRQVELINDTNIPWTTGAAMLVDGFQPLAQELLTYTSPGGICRVPVTVAVDLRGKAVDHETDRKLQAVKWRNYHYAQVDGKINLELVNNKTEKVPVEIRLQFGGRAKQATADGKITHSAYREEDWERSQGDAINNSSVVEWTAEVEPGECFKPETLYEFLVRH